MRVTAVLQAQLLHHHLVDLVVLGRGLRIEERDVLLGPALALEVDRQQVGPGGDQEPEDLAAVPGVAHERGDLREDAVLRARVALRPRGCPARRRPRRPPRPTGVSAERILRMRSRLDSVEPTHIERKFFSFTQGKPISLAKHSTRKVLALDAPSRSDGLPRPIQGQVERSTGTALGTIHPAVPSEDRAAARGEPVAPRSRDSCPLATAIRGSVARSEETSPRRPAARPAPACRGQPPSDASGRSWQAAPGASAAPRWRQTDWARTIAERRPAPAPPPVRHPPDRRGRGRIPPGSRTSKVDREARAFDAVPHEVPGRESYRVTRVRYCPGQGEERVDAANRWTADEKYAHHHLSLHPLESDRIRHEFPEATTTAAVIAIRPFCSY